MKKRSLARIQIILLLGFLVCCSGETQKPQDLVSYLDDLGKRYEDVCVEMGMANWNLYSKEGEADQDTPKRKFAELLLVPAHLEIVEEGLEKTDRAAEPRLYRRLLVWKDVLTAAKVDMDEEIFKLENTLEKEITDYEHDVAGESVPHKELRRALDAAYEDPLKREKKHEECMTKMQETLEPRVLELMKMRNAKSREVGFSDYGELCLYMMGLLPEGTRWFYDALELLDRKTLEPYKRLLAKAMEEAGMDEIDGDNLENLVDSMGEPRPRRKVAPDANPLDLAKETLMNIGFDVDALPIRIVEENIPYGGLGLAIKVPTDHRIVVQRGRGRVGLFLHELGHGLQAVHTTWPEPIFKNYEWCLGAYGPAFDEGMAGVAEGFSSNEKWQIKYNGKSAETLAAEEASRRLTAPYSIRSRIAEFLFEIELYKDLDKDPSEIAKELQEKWLLVESSSDPQKNWATSVFPVAYPIYDQNYFLASIIEWQVHVYLEKAFGENYIFDPEVGTWLKQNLYAMGQGLHWMDRIEKATGKKLDIEGWLASQGID